MDVLKELLTEETYEQVAEQLKDKDVKLANLKDGQYVAVEKYNTAVEDLKTTRTELEQRTNDLTELQELEGLNEETKNKLDTLKNEFEAKEQDYQAQLKENEKNAYLTSVVLRANPIDEVAVKAHVDKFIQDKEFADGNIEGLDTFVNELRENNSYLFEGTPKATGKEFGNAPKPELTTEEDIANKIYGKEGE